MANRGSDLQLICIVSIPALFLGIFVGWSFAPYFPSSPRFCNIATQENGAACAREWLSIAVTAGGTFLIVYITRVIAQRELRLSGRSTIDILLRSFQAERAFIDGNTDLSFAVTTELSRFGEETDSNGGGDRNVSGGDYFGETREELMARFSNIRDALNKAFSHMQSFQDQFDVNSETLEEREAYRNALIDLRRSTTYFFVDLLQERAISGTYRDSMITDIKQELRTLAQARTKYKTAVETIVKRLAVRLREIDSAHLETE